MTDMKHTPRPWFANQHRGFNEWIIGPGRGSHVCTIRFGKDRPEAEANKNLITAAPEMLEALKVACEMLDEMRPHSDGLAQVKSAIAKATGTLEERKKGDL